MRKYVFIGLELAALALVLGSMLNNPPLWSNTAAAPGPAATTLAQTH